MPPATPPSSSSVIVEIAGPRAIAKCRVCSKQIDPNNVRIGVKVYKAAGRGIDHHHAASCSVHWLHAVCSLHAEKSPDKRAKCRHCHSKIEKGALRVGVRGGSMTCTAWHHLECVRELFDHNQLREAGIDVATQFNPWWVMGYSQLTLEEKQRLTAVLGCKLNLDDLESKRKHDERKATIDEKVALDKRNAKRKRKADAEDKAGFKTCRWG